jgi:hypothetical protein
MSSAYADLPSSYKELLPYVQQAPDQGETNTCLFQASTGAMELLLNKRDGIRNPVVGGKNDLSESFLIWQKLWTDRSNPSYHFIEGAVKDFNYGEAVHNKFWPFKAYNEDGTDSMEAWNKHPDFENLPRMSVPQVKTELLFARGKKWATRVLLPEDITTIKETLATRKSPIIINYNDDSYWHVILIVGYDDSAKGECYQIEKDECNEKGAFYVRDSNGNKYEARAYNWFLINGNAGAVVELK